MATKAQRSPPVRRKEPKPRTGGRSARVVAEVLGAALQEFAEHGYAGLTVEAVAARAGVNKTTVYRRWPSKAELLAAAFVALRDEEPEAPDTGSLRDDLLQLLRQVALRMATPIWRALMQSLLLGNSDPELQALMQRMRDTRPAIPPVVIERAIRRRELPPGSGPELIVSALLGPLHVRIIWRRLNVDERFLRGLINLVVSGAAAGGARSP